MVVTSSNRQYQKSIRQMYFPAQTFLQVESSDQAQITEGTVPQREQVDRPKTPLRKGPYIYEMYMNIVHGFCIYKWYPLIYVHYQKLLCMPCSFDF